MAFFGALFAARTDEYAVRFDNQRTGKSGWVPAVRGGWQKSVRHEERSYPLLDGDRCWWLAADFDGPEAMFDVFMYVKAGRALQVPVALEVSRSGVGAHAWVFFTAPVPAETVRRLGTGLLREAMALRGRMTLASYDRRPPGGRLLTCRATRQDSMRACSLGDQRIARDLVDHDRHEDPPLVRGQFLLHNPAHLGQDARGLRVPRWVDPEPVGQPLPLPGVKRDRRVAPVVPAELGRHLKDDEPVRPGDEPALAAEVSELGQDRKHCVAGGLVRDVIQFRAGHRGAGRPAPDLGQRDADQPGVELTLGRLPLRARSGRRSCAAGAARAGSA